MGVWCSRHDMAPGDKVSGFGGKMPKDGFARGICAGSEPLKGSATYFRFHACVFVSGNMGHRRLSNICD
jgi:hypothetical protein